MILSIFRIAMPLFYAAMGGILSESAGIVALGLEGFMMMGAFIGASSYAATHSIPLAILAACLAGGFIAAFYALLSMRVDQIIAGSAMNMLVLGLVPSLSKAWYESGTSTPMFDPVSVALPLYAMPCVLFCMVVLYKLPVGLWIRAAGECPQALSAAGISVFWVRFCAVTASGVLAGFGGCSLSLFLASSYTRNMSAGRGFLALTCMIFGGWKPIPTLIACLFFGALDVCQMYMQGIFASQLIQVVPYAVTMLALAGFVGTKRAPKYLGVAMLLVVCACTKVPQTEVPVVEAALVAPAQVHAEMLHEMYTTVFRAEPPSREEFGSLVDSLNQGASLEGIYRGLVFGEAYRRLEEKEVGHVPAPVRTVFERECSLLEMHLLKKLTPFEHVGGFYRLKRLLADRALLVLEQMKTDPRRRALYFGDFASRMALLVDAHLPERNKQDIVFHTAWADQADPDRIIWEMLLRLHLAMNQSAQ